MIKLPPTNDLPPRAVNVLSIAWLVLWTIIFVAGALIIWHLFSR